MKKQRDILLIMAVCVLLFVALYGVWCWFAKIRWGIEPPEGTSLAVLGAGAAQLLVGGGIQMIKKLGQSGKAKELGAENRELKRQLAAANKQLDRIRTAAGQLQTEQV